MGKKISQYVLIVLVALGVILSLYGLIMGDADPLEENTAPYTPMIVFTYILFIIAILTLLWGSVMFVVTQPHKLKSMLISIGAFLAVLAISYVLADDIIYVDNYPEDTTATVSKMVGFGLYAFYILFIGAIGSIVFSTVSKLFK